MTKEVDPKNPGNHDAKALKYKQKVSELAAIVSAQAELLKGAILLSGDLLKIANSNTLNKSAQSEVLTKGRAAIQKSFDEVDVLDAAFAARMEQE